MAIISMHYFGVQKLTFAGLGIDLMISDAKSLQSLVKRPALLYGLLISSFFNFMLVAHFAYAHLSDFVELTDSLPLLCQLLLCLLKIAIFLNKRQDILLLIKDIHDINFKANREEMLMVRQENARDNFFCTLYFRMLLATGTFGITSPVIYSLYVYFTTGEIVLIQSNKATYFWNYTDLVGYSVVYVLHILTTYFTCVVSLAFDTLFFWFVSNIVAQFHIIGHLFEQLDVQHSKLAYNHGQQEFHASVSSCIQYHRQTLYLTDKLNYVYGEIIFIKIIVLCSEICCLVFQAGRPNESLAKVGYKSFFLCALALQLMLYCWNGQRIKDESTQVSTAIYCAFDWSRLSCSYKKIFLLAMMRSQRCSRIACVFFEVDLQLYLWVFKTASSLLAALKTLDENQE